jgi:hypothetical protein
MVSPPPGDRSVVSSEIKIKLKMISDCASLGWQILSSIV